MQVFICLHIIAISGATRADGIDVMFDIVKLTDVEMLPCLQILKDVLMLMESSPSFV